MPADPAPRLGAGGIEAYPLAVGDADIRLADEGQSMNARDEKSSDMLESLACDLGHIPTVRAAIQAAYNLGQMDGQITALQESPDRLNKHARTGTLDNPRDLP